MSNTGLNEEAWKKLFKKYDILQHIEDDGYFNISAIQIKEFREPRLMTKFDHSVNLPMLFLENNLSILPITRGDYVISHFDAYHKFEPYISDIINNSIPKYIQSLDSKNISSEAIALNCAFVSGIIADFLEDTEIVPTVSGRMGSGKFSLELMKACIEKAGAQIVTLALRRANEGGLANILDYVPKDVTLLPNTSGARNAQEAVRIARLSRELGCGDFVKLEVIHDSKYLLPDNYETIKATEILAKEGFVVMPYMYPDLNAARDLVNAGAACVMPLGSPIGSNKGICTKEFIQILIDEIDLPIIVDAGIGRPSQACEAMEMGASAVMANTAIATAGDVQVMAEAFKKAIEAGRSAYLSGLGRILDKGASASSPLTGFLHE